MACVFRDATSDDCDVLMGLIQEIAAYHNLLEHVTINSQILKADGFGEHPFFKCILAETPAENESKPARTVGYALYYFGYSVNRGRIMYLENLFVVAEFRGSGIGKQFMAKLAEVALQTGCTEIHFVTMEWNREAKDFYLRLGAHDTTESEQWHCMVLQADALRRLAQGRKSPQ